MADISPGNLDQAIGFHQKGRFKEAELVYRSILDQTPDHPEALHLLGLIAYQTGNVPEALELILAAIKQKTDESKYHYNLGFVLEASGRQKDALSSYWAALKLDPENVKTIGRMQYIGQTDPHLWFSLGNHFFRIEKYEKAILNYKKALELNNDFVPAHINLAAVAERLGQGENLIRLHYEKAIKLMPDSIEANFNLALFLENSGRVDSALKLYEKVLKLDPDHAAANYCISNIRLLKGDFENGFKTYEWRMRMNDWVKNYPSFIFEKKEWTGEPFNGKTLLIHDEQGYGDTLMFVRYIPLVKKLGGEIIVVSRKPLFNLLKQMPGIDVLMERSTDPRNYPAFDFYIFLLSLPKIFNTRLETIPANVPYIAADPNIRTELKNKIETRCAFKVGLVWAGQPKHKNDRNRSIPLEQFNPLLEMKDIRFVGLQKGERSGDINHLISGNSFSNIGEACLDFSDTGSVILNLDLVITIDTSVAHLAGAMGKEVWVLLPFNNDWRWLENTNQSPWYPTMTLFRQHQPGNWESVIKDIKEKLLKRFR